MERQTRGKNSDGFGRRTAKKRTGRFQKAMEGFGAGHRPGCGNARSLYNGRPPEPGAELSSAIGRELGLSEDRIYGLHMASVIHDLGKLTIPGEILCKPGRLSAPEYAMIQTQRAIRL